MNAFLTKLFRWYFSREAAPYWVVLFFDCLTVLIAGLYVRLLNYGFAHVLADAKLLFISYLQYLPCALLGFRLFHTYSIIMRYSSFVDLRNVALSVSLGAACAIAIRELFPSSEFLIFIRVRDILFTALLSFVGMSLMRIMVKYAYETIHRLASNRRGAFVFGVKEGGLGLAKGIANMENSPFRLEGFVSPVKEMHKLTLMGVPVYNIDDQLVKRMKQAGAEVLLVSPQQSQFFRKQTQLVDQLVAARIQIYMMPDAVKWDGQTRPRVSQLHEVDIEDLLPREEIEVDMLRINRQLCGKRILITGAAGSIGSELVRQVAKFQPEELILIDQAESPMHDLRLYMRRYFPHLRVLTVVADICNVSRMELLFKEHQPDCVFHAAAYKHVPMMEDNPSEAVQNNVYGTRVLADLAVRYQTKKFVMISTDKAVNPTNVMGCCKRICEIYVQSLDKAIKEGKVAGVTQFVTTRFGNVLGSNGSVIPLFREQIKQGGPVTVTHPEIIRYFMLIPEACKLVLEAGVHGNGGEIFVFDMGQQVRIVDLAKRMILLSGAKGVSIQYTGLRDGEKLFEELLSKEEETKPTYHPKIRIATVREYDYEQVIQEEEKLYKLSFSYDDMAVVQQMKRMVPEYKSQHSKYEVLDTNSTQKAV